MARLARVRSYSIASRRRAAECSVRAAARRRSISVRTSWDSRAAGGPPPRRAGRSRQRGPGGWCTVCRQGAASRLGRCTGSSRSACCSCGCRSGSCELRDTRPRTGELNDLTTLCCWIPRGHSSSWPDARTLKPRLHQTVKMYLAFCLGPDLPSGGTPGPPRFPGRFTEPKRNNQRDRGTLNHNAPRPHNQTNKLTNYYYSNQTHQIHVR
jgi:hypothetical protein